MSTVPLVKVFLLEIIIKHILPCSPQFLRHVRMSAMCNAKELGKWLAALAQVLYILSKYIMIGIGTDLVKHGYTWKRPNQTNILQRLLWSKHSVPMDMWSHSLTSPT